MGEPVSQSTYDLIRQAILEKQQVLATYHEHRRELCPHVLGEKNGKPHALVYQFGGTSRRGPLGPDGSPENWRCMFVDELSDVRLRAGEWHTARPTPGAAPEDRTPQTCVETVDVRVRG